MEFFLRFQMGNTFHMIEKTSSRRFNHEKIHVHEQMRKKCVHLNRYFHLHVCPSVGHTSVLHHVNSNRGAISVISGAPEPRMYPRSE